jgi:ribosomal protein S18 acetylase RimI-like enzyme
LFNHLKKSEIERSLEFALYSQGDMGSSHLYCKPVGSWIFENQDWLEQMMAARENSKEMYFARFPPSLKSLKEYLVKGPINNPNQILFVILDNEQQLFGHFGFKLGESKTIEVDNVLRIKNGHAGALSVGIDRLMSFLVANHGCLEFSLKVLSTNNRAIRLYESLGFALDKEYFLKLEQLEGDITSLTPCQKLNSNVDAKMQIYKKKYLNS